MPKNQTQLLSFIDTVANMPARSQALCALVVSALETAEEQNKEVLQKLSEQGKPYPHLTVVRYVDMPALEKKLTENTTQQSVKTPRPVVCLITEAELAANNFDQFSPLIFRLDSTDKQAHHD